jgi:glutathione S-transferase
MRLNPSKKIPVLLHGEGIFTESLAIMEYLNDISKAHNLIPINPSKAFHYRKIVHYGLTEVEPYLWIAEQASHLRALYNWPDGTYEQAMVLLKQNINLVWQWVDNTAIHITGEEFTLADIYYYHLITWPKQHNIEYPIGVESYLKQLQAREAFPEEMLSNSSIPIKQ